MVLPENDANIVEKWISNEMVLDMVGAKRKLLATIKKRQLRLLGHVVRPRGMEKLPLGKKMDGRRSRGRRRQSFMEGQSLAARCGTLGVLGQTGDRTSSKWVIANVSLRQGTLKSKNKTPVYCTLPSFKFFSRKLVPTR